MRHMLSYILIVLLFNSCDNSPTDGGGGATTTGGDSVDCTSFSDQMDCLDAECTWTMTGEGNYCWDGDTTTGGEEEVPLVEDYFSCNISSKLSYYWFEEVLINSEKIDSDDWVAAFNGEICVGFQKWTCSDNCNLAVYGVNELTELTEELTEGYMRSGEVPSFKIYDASEHIYYDAIPSQEFEWQDGNILNEFQADSLSAPAYTGRTTGGSGGH